MSLRKRTWTSGGETKTAWVYDGVDETGQRIRKQFGTKAEAVAYRDDAAAKLNTNSYRRAADKITIAHLAEMYINECDSRRSRGENMTRESFNTIKGHILNYIVATKETRAHQYVTPFHEGIGGLKLSRVTKTVVKHFGNRLRSSGVSIALSRSIISTMHTMFKFAIEENFLALNPAAGIEIKGPRDETRNEKRTAPPKWFVREVLEEAKRISDLKRSAKLSAQIAIAATTGIRASEQKGLRWRNIDCTRRELSVETRIDRFNHDDGHTKSAAGQRSIPLGAETIAIVEQWRAVCGNPDPNALVFSTRNGKPINHNDMRDKQFYKLFDRMMERYETDPTRYPQPPGRFKWHELRHFAISTWIESNVNIKKVMTWAGHSSVQMTMDRYGHMFKSEADWAIMDQISGGLLSAEARSNQSVNEWQN